jgi:hypothetical protein
MSTLPVNSVAEKSESNNTLNFHQSRDKSSGESADRFARLCRTSSGNPGFAGVKRASPAQTRVPQRDCEKSAAFHSHPTPNQPTPTPSGEICLQILKSPRA